ncbi:hypothetical protein [Acrocarpospora catenulata]|uniref:hypothetical protein n=1 Tax=Acrocarpospora catenulata TaxID=2836182 RepID=UPI002023B78E|nr:hypothetical protein [Acrocarpospora catenulata]
MFTIAPDVFNNGVEEFVQSIEGLLLPWQQAVNTRFDLAIAAAYGHVHEVHAPLIVMEHGNGFNKRVSWAPGKHVAGERPTYGLDAQRLVRNGNVIASSIVLSHQTELGRLGRACPQALPVAQVVGDPCYDRLAASMPNRNLYRRALDAGPRQKVLVVTSTWGRHSLFARRLDLFSRVVHELPANEYRVVALLHPNVWFGHSRWQVRTWLADCQRRGLRILMPEQDWRGVLVAADWVIGDQGSATLYGASIGVPVALASFEASEVDPESAMADLAAVVPRINRYQPLRTQLDRVAAVLKPTDYQRVEERVTSEPGRFHRNMRRLMYRLMGLRQPSSVPIAIPVPLPVLVTGLEG